MKKRSVRVSCTPLTRRAPPLVSPVVMKVACVGCGYWGKNYVRVLHELAREGGASGVSSDIIVCDRDQELLDAIRGRFPAIQVTRELDDVLGDEAAVDALIVATPASTHYAIVKQCLAAKKHVLVEKPLTLKAEEAVALSKMAEGVGRTHNCSRLVRPEKIPVIPRQGVRRQNPLPEYAHRN